MQSPTDYDKLGADCDAPSLLDTIEPGVAALDAWSTDHPNSDECADQELVARCLLGDEWGWATLINRYKRLIYSFPRRYGASPADAADVFQLVCAELFRALPRLRNHASLRAWIMTVASHQSYQWKRRRVLQSQRESDECDAAADDAVAIPARLEQAERDEAVREAIVQLPPRCRALVQMLFYRDPPSPYERVAGELGLAIGSIGLTRMRCLKRLERMLSEAGVRL